MNRKDFQRLLALRGLEACLELREQRHCALAASIERFGEMCAFLNAVRRAKGLMIADLCAGADASPERILRVLHGSPEADLGDVVAVGLLCGYRLNVDIIDPRQGQRA